MDFDNIADNEDQLYRELLEEEQKNTGSQPPKQNSNNYDNELDDDH